MEKEQIQEILERGENQEVEFKESFHSHQQISKIICAFANTSGGVLFLGINKKSKIVGVKEDLDRLQQKISASNQNISSPATISVKTKRINNKDIIIVIIQRSSDNMYHTFEGAIYVRIGSTTKRLEGQTQLEYLRSRQILCFDEQYELNVDMDDLDINKIKQYLKARDQENYLNNHTIKDFLVSTKLASINGKFKIKNPTILLFGKDPIFFFPQIEIKLVRFFGEEAVEIIDHRLVKEDLMNSIESSISFIKKNISKGIKITGEAKSKEIYEYPLKVIREAIVNAVAHRDYYSKDSIQIYVFKDRIEITNPGSIPSGLPKELFGSISVQRNPITYRILRDLGYVEGLGTGIPRMKNEMRKRGLRDPEFIFTETFFRIILRNKKGRRKPIEQREDLNDRQINLLKHLKANKTIKAENYAKDNKISHPTAVKDLNELVEFKYLRKVGIYRGAYYILSEKKLKR